MDKKTHRPQNQNLWVKLVEPETKTPSNLCCYEAAPLDAGAEAAEEDAEADAAAGAAAAEPESDEEEEEAVVVAGAEDPEELPRESLR